MTARARAIVARRDVDDAAVRVGAVQCRALRTTNDLEPLDRRRIDLPDEQRVRDLDPVDVDLRVAEAERARAADTAVAREQRRRRLLPHPHAGHRPVDQVCERAALLAGETLAAHDVERDRSRALFHGRRCAHHHDAFEHTRARGGSAHPTVPADAVRRIGARTTWSSPATSGSTRRSAQQLGQDFAGGHRSVRQAQRPIQRQQLGHVRQPNAGGIREPCEPVTQRDVVALERDLSIERRRPVPRCRSWRGGHRRPHTPTVRRPAIATTSRAIATTATPRRESRLAPRHRDRAAAGLITAVVPCLETSAPRLSRDDLEHAVGWIAVERHR